MDETNGERYPSFGPLWTSQTPAASKLDCSGAILCDVIEVPEHPPLRLHSLYDILSIGVCKGYGEVVPAPLRKPAVQDFRVDRVSLAIIIVSSS